MAMLPAATREAIHPDWTAESAFSFAIVAGTIAGLSSIDLPLILQQIPHTTCTVPIPLNPPQDQAAAEAWSSTYWPTVRRSHNPFGPQPSQWRAAEAQMGGNERAAAWMAAARQLGVLARQTGRGVAVGALIVDAGAGRIVAGAGDARWLDFCSSPSSSSSPGAVQAHATMRAIAMVGKQRVALRDRHTPPPPLPPKPPSLFYMDIPLTSLESALAADSPLKPNGYVCTGLDLYLTHDPCVMCCMAILHSRFERVVFGKATSTGGLLAEREADDDDETAEAANGTDPASRTKRVPSYGLWHRSELNWRLMAWQWADDEEDEEGAEAEKEEEVLHA